ncbi:GDSL esterase/lipase At5g55050-like [Cornus florida]|uniref:GDSL esterase/lipase At5g55050-like n=1 Tax=Cornus florida TaxID=4283 RepID=UPI002899414D|nr:GDSL esterase/lipase At5g55050-like [Cornus florida]
MEMNYASPLLLMIFSLAMFTSYVVEAKVPAIFILGDSTADVGTNNYLPASGARADFPHNGIDFPHSRSTGRFSNGFNSADFLAKLMGFKRSPNPFFLLLNQKSSIKRPSFRGVNFASGGSGLLDLTGQNNQQMVIPLSEQIAQFATIYNNLTAVKGAEVTKQFLSESLFSISVGSNDIFGYFYSNTTITEQEFIAILMNTYERYIRALYNLGARKFGIISVPPIGCCPSQRVFNATGGCLENINEAARAFHSALDTLLSKLSSDLQDMKYSLGNTYKMTIDVIDNPLPNNFKDVQSACCGSGRLNAEVGCLPDANLCANRNEYLFWDLYHPTQAASRLAALTLYHGTPEYVAPINFAQLADDY